MCGLVCGSGVHALAGSFMVLYGIAPEQVQSLLVSVCRSCHLDEEFATRLIEGAQRFTSPAYQASRPDATRGKMGGPNPSPGSASLSSSSRVASAETALVTDATQHQSAPGSSEQTSSSPFSPEGRPSDDHDGAPVGEPEAPRPPGEGNPQPSRVAPPVENKNSSASGVPGRNDLLSAQRKEGDSLDVKRVESGSGQDSRELEGEAKNEGDAEGLESSEEKEEKGSGVRKGSNSAPAAEVQDLL